MASPHIPLRLTLDGGALVANWRWLRARGGAAACGAAIKADGYGLGAGEAARLLAGAGCRDFFVASWPEVKGAMPALGEAGVSVLHGLVEADLPFALACPARPVINTPAQAQLWREAGGGQPCDVMLDTGMNRLGLSAHHVAAGALDGLEIDVLMSHLACADEDVPMNARQRRAFVALAARVKAGRLSLANSAGICLGENYAFDLTRPGIALYGGVPRREAAGHIRQVARVEAQIVQRRRIGAGDSVGYNATFVAGQAMELAILNIGYADGYLRSFSNSGLARADGIELPVVGRISMDLTAIDVGAAADLGEGDWVELDYDLASASAQSGLSQYELLTTLGTRHRRLWR